MTDTIERQTREDSGDDHQPDWLHEAEKLRDHETESIAEFAKIVYEVFSE